MATQCHRLAVHSPAARLSPPHAYSPSSRPNSRLNNQLFFGSKLRGERLQSKRMAVHSLSSTARPVVQCVSSTVGGSSSEEVGESGGDRVQSNVISKVWAKAPEPVKVFPWDKAGWLFVKRVQYHFWTVGKWLVIPVFAVSMLSELSYTLSKGKLFIIISGMIGGFAFAGILKETAIELNSEYETGETPWHLVQLGLLFAALKLIGPYLPGWGRVSVPHFANGGFLHVIKLVNDWKRQHAERTPVKRG